jgi:hypothetical protein
MWTRYDSRAMRSLFLLLLPLPLLLLNAPAEAKRRPELDHIGAYNFMVDIEGVNAGYFKNVDGISAEIEVIEYQNGDDPMTLRKRPGRAKVVLTGGYLPNHIIEALIGDERKRTIRLPIIRRPDTQVLAGKTLCTYELHGARVLGVRARSVTNQDMKFTVHDVTLAVDEQTHDCEKYFVHPKDRLAPGK